MYTQLGICRNICITSATQQKIVEFCGVSALLFTFRGMWLPRLYLVVYDLVIPTARLERAGSDTRRSVCHRITFRNTIAKSTNNKICSTRLLCFSRLLRMLNINFRDYNSRIHRILLVRAIVRDIRMKPPI